MLHCTKSKYRRNVAFLHFYLFYYLSQGDGRQPYETTLPLVKGTRLIAEYNAELVAWETNETIRSWLTESSNKYDG